MSNFSAIVYLSNSNYSFDLLSMNELADRCARLNEEVQVTGYLYYENGMFVQYIEGEKEVINALMDRISRDKRHTVRKVLKKDQLKFRKFPSWHMQYINKKSLIEINMENLLINQIEYIAKVEEVVSSADGQQIIETDQNAIWRMVDQISNHRIAIQSA